MAHQLAEQSPMKLNPKVMTDVLTVFMIFMMLFVMDMLNDFQMTKIIRDLWNSFH